MTCVFFCETSLVGVELDELLVTALVTADDASLVSVRLPDMLPVDCGVN